MSARWGTGEGATRLWRVPRGVPLPEAEWRSRHRLVVAVLMLHLPGLGIYALLTGNSSLGTVAQVMFIAAFLVLAATPGSRMRRSLSATVGLMSCSATLVAVSHGMSLVYFHFFVMTILVALYQDWRPFVTAFVFVVFEPLLLGTLDFHGYDGRASGTGDAVRFALAHGAFLAAAGAVLMVFWAYSQGSYAREERYRAQLLDTEMGAVARMREASQMREDLIASVSHEFRTPLTAIHGVVATLRSQGERISPDVRDSLLAGIDEHGARLARLLEDMLAAASAAVSDPTAVADVSNAVRVAGQRAGVCAIAASGLAAAVAPATLDQLLAALLRHGLDHARLGPPIEMEGIAEGADVLILLRYYSDADTAECPKRLLEPFASRESAVTGRPISMNLYLARRLAEVNDGRIEAVVGDGNAVTISVRLRALRTMREPAPPIILERMPEVVRSG